MKEYLLTITKSLTYGFDLNKQNSVFEAKDDDAAKNITYRMREKQHQSIVAETTIRYVLYHHDKSILNISVSRGEDGVVRYEGW